MPNITKDKNRLAVSVRYVKPDTQIYHPYSFKYGQEHSYIGMKNLCLERWKSVLVRGTDQFKVNGDRVISKQELLKSLQPKSMSMIER